MFLIDNKTDRYKDDGYNIVTVWDFIKDFSSNKKGKFDIVTGYFTVGALCALQTQLDENVEFRIISSELTSNENFKRQHIIDLLNGDTGIEKTLALSFSAKKAAEFLRRQNVQVRAILESFCHAKTYLFKNANAKDDNFYISGSSNLTDSGLGLKKSPNIELNVAAATKLHDSDFEDLKKWFTDVWNNASAEIPADFDRFENPETNENESDEAQSEDKAKKIAAKEYFIRQIERYFIEYTPEQIYCKILFELFRADLDLNKPLTKEIALLQTSEIWNTLFNYQQKGVISLVKMLQKYGGAVLADAVGLGKTFSALAVIKYFSLKNYETLILCPKRLEQNWTQYLRKNGSRFEKDEFDYVVRFHSDLQNDRLESYKVAKLSWLASRKKLLIVIDESHNLRNEKSLRYKELLEKLIKRKDERDFRDIKILMLSATPLNTGLSDVKGQFNLIARGDDFRFDDETFKIKSLTRLFADCQKKYNEWTKDDFRTIGSFISMLNHSFFNLTDKLIVARTRNLIEKVAGESLGFPEKEKPENVYQGVESFGKYKNTEEIYSAFERLNLTAYQPNLFLPESEKIAEAEAKNDWKSEVFRDRFLVKMMGMLFMKRLESSWKSCLITVEKVLRVHEETLKKVKKLKAERKQAADSRDSSLKTNETESRVGFGAVNKNDLEEELEEELEGAPDDFLIRKGTVDLRKLKNLSGFAIGLIQDKVHLSAIYKSLKDFEEKFERGEEKDLKLERLIEILKEKQKAANKKVVIFTAYADTADFLFCELTKRGFGKIACVSGQSVKTSGNHATDGFTEVLESFAPYSKLYKEKEWSGLYEKAKFNNESLFNKENRGNNVSFDEWKSLIEKYDKKTNAKLRDEINILIATDCLSEGQNLQDADLQINYDIHWNPVRLIQRFGRIDRIGSPNKKIRCANFWPAKSFEDYLKLEERVKNRMLVMNLVGTETQTLNEEYEALEKDNPLFKSEEEKLLRQLSENSVSDIESEKSQTLSMKDFSFEVFRQDFTEYFEKNKAAFLKMPQGVFSGFKTKEKSSKNEESLIAVLGYPKREEESEKPYEEIYLIMQNADEKSSSTELSRSEILNFLRDHKNEKRFVPDWIEKEESEKIQKLSAIADSWMKTKIPNQAASAISSLLKNGTSRKSSLAVQTIQNETKKPRKKTLAEDKFKKENFDLIVWEYVSAK